MVPLPESASCIAQPTASYTGWRFLVPSCPQNYQTAFCSGLITTSSMRKPQNVSSRNYDFSLSYASSVIKNLTRASTTWAWPKLDRAEASPLVLKFDSIHFGSTDPSKWNALQPVANCRFFPVPYNSLDLPLPKIQILTPAFYYFHDSFYAHRSKRKKNTVTRAGLWGICWEQMHTKVSEPCKRFILHQTAQAHRDESGCSCIYIKASDTQ